MNKIDEYIQKAADAIDAKLRFPKFVYMLIGFAIILGGFYIISRTILPNVHSNAFLIWSGIVVLSGTTFIMLGVIGGKAYYGEDGNENKIINFETTASFDVDCQKGFTPLCPSELPVVDGHLIVDELNAQAKFAKFRIGSKDVHPDNAIWIASEDKPQFSPVEGENVDIRWNKHCMSGTAGAELLDGLPSVKDYDYFIFKGIEPDLHPYSACYHDLGKKLSTGVIEWLKDRGVKTVFTNGLATDFCVYQTVVDLLPHFNVIINKSATKSIGNFDETVKKLEAKGAIFVENASELYNL